jgi:hypothetical protein
LKKDIYGMKKLKGSWFYYAKNIEPKDMGEW